MSSIKTFTQAFAIATIACFAFTACAPETTDAEHKQEQSQTAQKQQPAKPEAADAKPDATKPEDSQKTEAAPEEQGTTGVGADFDATLIDDPMSIWVVSNKHRALNPIDFEPSDLIFPEGVTNANEQPLREAAAVALTELVQAAANDGVYVGMTSAYRPYWMQESLYYGYVERDGQELADRYSARPGHSEHQTGLTVDFDDFSGCGLMECFESTPAGVWLQDHAHEFGFIMRYPDGFEHIVGFMYEPWHYRYVGVDLATQMRNASVKTLEEWFNLPPAPDYVN